MDSPTAIMYGYLFELSHNSSNGTSFYKKIQLWNQKSSFGFYSNSNLSKNDEFIDRFIERLDRHGIPWRFCMHQFQQN